MPEKPPQEPIIQSIRHPKCRCTATRICKRCQPNRNNVKFEKPWAEAVRENNEKERSR